ncbi:MAG: hypothetical protein WD995_14440 [Gemmatimonadota bacterium]
MAEQIKTAPLERRETRSEQRGEPGSDSRRMVLRVLATSEAQPTEPSFLTRRAYTAVADLADPWERKATSRALDVATAAAPDVAPLVSALLEWAGGLEARGLLDECDEVLSLARSFRPSDAEILLHSARVARKAGHVDRARLFYDRVTESSDAAVTLGHMAMIGHALLSENPEAQLGTALRSALEAGDSEAAAVAQEGRARVRRARGDVSGAMRDYWAAGTRYHDPIDRGRVGHEAADMLMMHGHIDGAREALLETIRCGHLEQVDHARTRLQAIARTQGDQVGLRRYADAAPLALVSLSPPAKSKMRGVAPTKSAIHRGLDRIRRASARN